MIFILLSTISIPREYDHDDDVADTAEQERGVLD